MYIVGSKYELRVSFEDIDSMNVVWHGNYIRYMEQARCDLFLKLGYTYMDMRDDNIVYPVAKMETKYIKPAYFSDKLTIETYILSVEPTLNIRYEIKKEGIKIFEAKTMQIGVDIKTKESIYKAPKRFLDKLGNMMNEML